MTFMHVTSCLSIMKTGRVGGKHPTIDLLIGTCWLAPFFSSGAHVNSPARYQLQCGVHEESFLFCLDPVVVLEFQWRLYADGLHLHLVSMSEQGHFWKMQHFQRRNPGRRLPTNNLSNGEKSKASRMKSPRGPLLSINFTCSCYEPSLLKHLS